MPETADLEQRLRDHAETIEHPAAEPLEQTGEMSVLELAVPDEAPPPEESSIVVEELAMPEVIELTGETVR